MSTRNASVVHIAPQGASPALSKTQKQFNTLVKKVERLKQELLDWRDEVPGHVRRLGSDYNPLRATFNSLRLQLAQLFDGACEQKRVARGDQKKLQHLIQEVTAVLLAEAPSDEAKALHDKYSDVGYDEQKEAVDDMVRGMVQEVFGFEVGADIDLSSPDKLDAFLEQKAHEEAQRRAQFDADAQRATRKKTAKQVAKEQQKKTEELNVQKTLQEVYRKLVAALHPDRERDAVERERKTELMQRVNVAYGKKDLSQLLELQLAAEQIDTLHINALSEGRLKHFNKILRQQCDELLQAIDEAQMPFRLQCDVAPFETITAKDVIARMEKDLKHLRRDVATLQQDLRDFRDVAVLKAWLREYRIPKQPGYGDIDYSDFMEWMPDEAPRRTRKR